MKLEFSQISLNDFSHFECKDSDLRAQFSATLESYLAYIDAHKAESERNLVANALKALLFDKLGFVSIAEQSQGNNNSNIDLVLKNGDSIEVLIEAKKPQSAEMFSAQNVNCKALHECIFYYLRERNNERLINTSIKFLIITDFYQFYIFKASEFDRLFYKNAQIQKLYKNFNSKASQFKGTTPEFYDEARKILDSQSYLESIAPKDNIKYNILDSSTARISGCCIDLRASSKADIAKLCALFSKDFLFALRTQDINIINEPFYHELLYLMGLEEQERNGKILIIPSVESKEGKNTLYYAIISCLESTHKEIFTQAKELLSRQEICEEVLEILILWINRLLFLKLLESNLKNFNKEQKDALSFLNTAKIKDFSTLNSLFFNILAKNLEQRESEPDTQSAHLKYLPYLNSSLFTRSPKELITINTLPENMHLEYFKSTRVLEDYKTPRNTPPSWLAYFFSFLDSYDFGLDSENFDTQRLISSSILGLVFEKLNGYKEGSFYTPSFITSYMCAQSLEKIVLDKFNALNPHWKAQNLKDLREEIRNEIRENRAQTQDIIAKYKALLDSIKICDPSVGSGHFLVSALNEMIAIHYKLDLLRFYKNAESTSAQSTSDLSIEYNLELQNDEVIIFTRGRKFAYTKPKSANEEAHIIQKRLFNLKRAIIENNLFGVDINPNSCEISRLRLWIELLKNAYYLDFEPQGFNPRFKSTHYLHTLPNIDINIKCGNSLVSNFPLDSHFTIAQTKDFANNLKTAIDEYKTHVELYKDALKDKDSITAKINDIKTMLKTYLLQAHASNARLIENLRAFVSTYGEDSFDIETPFGMEMIKIIKKKQKEGKGFRFQPTLESLEPKALDKQGENLLSLLYKDFEFLESMRSNDTFEWRFEFPEVLDSNGDFLGFDLVIGNPPYIRQEEIKHLKPHLEKAFEIYSGTSDIYTYFYEQGYNVLRQDGILSFITSNKYTRAGYGEALRAFLRERTSILSYTELNGFKVFDKASVDTSILSFKKRAPSSISGSINGSINALIYAHPKLKSDAKKSTLDLAAVIAEQECAREFAQDKLDSASWSFPTQVQEAIKQKIESIGTPLKEWDISIYRGILTGYNEAFIIDSAKREEILNNCKDDDERTRTQELIKPILRGRDIKRYSYEWAGLWIINTHNGYTANTSHCEEAKPTKQSTQTRIPPIDIEQHPALKAHFDKMGQSHKGKGKGFYNRDDKGITPYNLRNCAYLGEFEKPKIIYSEIVHEPQFYLDNGDFKFGNLYAEATSFVLTGEYLEYLIALLHSKTATFAFKNFYAGGGLGESGYRYKKAFLKNLPIPKIDSSNKKIADKIIKLVEQILEQKAQDSAFDTSALESEIDSLVYKLYSLTESEIKTIES